MNSNLLLLGAAVSVGLACSHASATKITNLTTNTVLFFDDYESAPEVSNAAYLDNTGDYDPVADIGTWVIGPLEGGDNGSGGEATPEAVQVTDVSFNFVDLGPFTGNNYLRVDRTTGFVGAFSVFTAPQTTAGDVIRLETMVGTAPFQNHDAAVQFSDSDGTRLFTLLFSGSGFAPRLMNRNVATNTSTTLTQFTNGGWHRLAIDHEIGSGVYDVTWDGELFSDLPIESSGNGSLGELRWSSVGHNSDRLAPLYLDAVPEPSSIGLCGLALACTLAYACRRKQE